MILSIFRMLAGAMLFAGVSALLASIVALGTVAASPVLKSTSSLLLAASTVFVAGGAAARYLSRPRGWRLRNERAQTSAAERPPLGGWLILLAVMFILLPVWTVLRLRPFLAEWRKTVDLLAGSDIWQTTGSNMGGIVLLPIAAALTPPFIELIALVSFVAGSAMALSLLLSRSPLFPRTYLVWMALTTALVVVSVLGAKAVTLAGGAIETLIQDSQPRGDEAKQLREVLGRYTVAVTSAAPVLLATLCGYLVWLPMLFSSRRARATFAALQAKRNNPPTDLEAITSTSRFPG
ncbi:MAG TPA: hypothetical protein VM791_15080 [Vicinamibacterales bacterium]|jgi:hypothetical protein|nr:hypothetical protein [Vicinamibacterales bacterium]